MKNKIKLLVLVLVFSVFSCEDNDKLNMNIHENSSTEAPYVRGIFKSTLIKYANIATSSVEVTLSEQIRSIAKRQGVSPETLLNLWVQEKLSKEIA